MKPAGPPKNKFVFEGKVVRPPEHREAVTKKTGKITRFVRFSLVQSRKFLDNGVWKSSRAVFLGMSVFEEVDTAAAYRFAAKMQHGDGVRAEGYMVFNGRVHFNVLKLAHWHGDKPSKGKVRARSRPPRKTDEFDAGLVD